MKKPEPLPPIPVVWYAAPTSVATDPTHLPYYLAVMGKLQDRSDTFPNLQMEFIYCPVKDTINLSGEAMLFVNFEQDLFNAGFRPVEIPNNGMDQKERALLREVILNGGKLHGIH